ncbi:glycosyltransferase family 39 protein [Dokdonella sp.]|uniref:ArnT family glycosyltransferase n=1 Tax=Dokdonella sp. TaxID=2291710 RepID=UPI0025C40E96|nr:glycosyltransferase family 39 protein [Dokdonella sp.]MBX3691943.1 glycosyltransferase family 39 protein [Dokdonella sp.]MCW5567427.1 glycosyltransferase family 39 protein [Dokdonella sp.]
MPSLYPRSSPAWHTPALLALVVVALAAGIGLREPMPADEPRFVLAAQAMVDSGDWLFPRRGSEFYAEKPPVFMWMQAASQVLVGNWRIAFLLPSLLAALGTLWLAGDLARRLWGSRAVPFAVFGLFVCLQFALQAKRAQIDMVLVGLTTLSLWALLRYLLEKPNPWLLALGTFAAGLGTVTKGVGFLPLLVFLPWLWVRRKASRELPAHRGVHALAGIGGFLLGTGVWLVPMLAAVLTSNDPALHAYAREMLLRQTGTRYVNAWHHVQPAWYYLQSMLTLWLPGILLLPWLLPAWWHRLRRVDPRHALLLVWALLVLLFFSATPGKREVYIFPMLPALCVAAAPLLPGLLRRRGVRATLWLYLGVLALAASALGGWLLQAPAGRLQPFVESRGMDLATAATLGAWLLGFGVAACAAMAFSALTTRRRPTTALIVVSAMLWITWGIGLMPALSPDSSAQAVMQRVGQRIGPDAELALLGWREQHLLQADRHALDFGFKRPWAEQWPLARDWLQAAPDRRWLFLRKDAVAPCIDTSRIVDIGVSNRRAWVLVPGNAWIAGCAMPADWTADSDGD